MPRDKDKKLIEKREAQEAAYHHFMAEYLYWEVVGMADRFEQHYWSKRQPDRDIAEIGRMLKYLRGLADDLHLIRGAIKEQGG